VKSRIVVEGKGFERTLIVEFLKEMVPEQEIRVIDGGGRSNTRSLARTILLDYQEPTVLIVNANTVNKDQLAEQTRELEMVLDMAADPGLWTVALFEPTLERCFFRNISFIEDLIGRRLTDVEKALAEYDPRRILTQLEPDYTQTLPLKWRGRSLAPLKEDPALARVCEFLERVHHRAAA
jgi:hypothetical protein